MRFPRWILAAVTVIFLWPGNFKAGADTSIFSADGFFDTVTRIAEHSGRQISSLIGRDYPEFPSDIAALVDKKYPSLREEVYIHLNTAYPGLYKEALRFIRRESPDIYQKHVDDVIHSKKDIIAGRIGPSDLLWNRLEDDPGLKVRVMAELDKTHPEIKLKILSRIDKRYPALKVDLFNLIVRKYPDMVWDVAKIATNEAVNELGRS
jgi:hypothetical protein